MTKQSFHSPFGANRAAVMVEAVTLAAQADHRAHGAKPAQRRRSRRPRGRLGAALAGVLLAAGATLIAVMGA